MLLSWYRERLREHGFMTATPLLVAVVVARCATLLANRVLPSRVVCPWCGWRGRRFFDFRDVGFNVPAMECPRCNSHPRHRLFFLWLRDEYRLRDRRGARSSSRPNAAWPPRGRRRASRRGPLCPMTATANRKDARSRRKLNFFAGEN